MCCRNRFVCLVVAVATATAAMGCATAPDADDQLEPEPRPEFPDLQASEVYEDASEWLPADSAAVATMVGEESWREAAQHMLPTSIPGAEPGQLGTAEGLEQDLRDEYRRILGFDPTDTFAMTVAITDGGGTVVMDGDYDDPEGLDELEVHGQTVYTAAVRDWFDDPQLQDIDLDVYFLPIDEPRDGMVATTDRQVLEDRLNGDEEAATLANDERGDVYARLYDEIDDASLAMVSPLAEVAEQLQLDAQLPDAVAFSLRDDDFGIFATGESDSLEELDEQLRAAVDEWFSPVHEVLGWEDLNVFDRLVLTYGYHGAASLTGQLDDAVHEEMLRYEVSRSAASDSALIFSLGAIFASALYAEHLIERRRMREELEEFEEHLEDRQPPRPEPGQRPDVTL